MKRRTIALLAVTVAVLAVVFQAEGQTPQPRKVAVVVDTSHGDATALRARADHALSTLRAAGAEAQLRVTHTPTQQLSVTHLLAAEGYAAIVGINLQKAVALDPVAKKYPGTTVTTDVTAAVTAAARR